MSAAADIRRVATRKEVAAEADLAAAKALEVAANAEGNPIEKAKLKAAAQALVAEAKGAIASAQAELADAQTKIASATKTIAAAKATSAEAEAKQSSAQNNLTLKQANTVAELCNIEPVTDKVKAIEAP